MARFHMGEENNYGNSQNTSKTNFFQLKKDGEVKKVRFMYKDANDIVGYAVHEIQVNGKRRYINCLREYNSPIDDCPLCKNGSQQKAKLYIPLYDVNDGNTYVWERGKKFFTRMSSLCSRFPDLVSHEFEIERHGAEGSTDTTYDIYEVGHDNTKLEDLPEVPNVLGGFVLDKNANEMNEYLRTGNFPKGGQPTPQVEEKRNEYVPQRRVPTGREVF